MVIASTVNKPDLMKNVPGWSSDSVDGTSVSVKAVTLYQGNDNCGLQMTRQFEVQGEQDTIWKTV